MNQKLELLCLALPLIVNGCSIKFEKYQDSRAMPYAEKKVDYRGEPVAWAPLFVVTFGIYENKEKEKEKRVSNYKCKHENCGLQPADEVRPVQF